MIVTNINGIDVKFPFEPYDIQRDYMSKVIECLETKQNGVLESPTGTGKTLSLLCSTLAWLEAKKAQINFEREEFKPKPNEEWVEMSGKTFLRLPTIIYASRTHSQLTQAVSELKVTAYNYMKACVIGSREQMCIHPEVVKEENNQTKITMCNLKTKSRACHFYNNLSRKKEDPNIRNVNVVDIEDLITMGKEHKFCPYFMAKEFKNNADIVFMPYNYLLEPKFRKTLGIKLENNIVILDEAHNVEKICESSASLQIKSSDIALAIEEVTTAMKMLTELPPNALDDDSVPKDFSAEDLVVLKQLLLDFEKEFDEIPLSNNPEGTTFGGLYIYEFLEKAGINQGNNQIVISLLEKLAEYLTVASAESFMQRKGAALKLIEDSLRVIFMDTGAAHKNKVDKCYKVHIIAEESKKRAKNTWLSKASKSSNRVLNFWCFSPGFGMNMLIAEGLTCCILTSGTLAPLKPLITELDFKNPVHLENPHVVEDAQLCVRIIANGPDNERLSCTYQNRDNENYLRSLGITIINVTRLIPNGLLIFFPSYPILNNCMEFWTNQGIWSKMNELKSIFVEPRDKDTFTKTMIEYYQKINDPNLKGAIFMGVCRGKVSEGLDFADLNGRGVIIIGLPFPPLKDPRVILKKRYLDKCKAENQEFIGGDKWYTLEACRAVNQAIGRVIRHRNDYGSIILLDERYRNNNILSQLSLWLRNRIKLVQNFGEITRDLRLFYKNASEKFPLNTKKKEIYVSETETNNLNDTSKTIPNSRNAYNCFNFNQDNSSNDASCSSSVNLEGFKKREANQLASTSKKRKLKLVSNSSNGSCTNEENSKTDDNREYIAMVQKVLDSQTFKVFLTALQSYRNNRNIEELKESLRKIFFHRQNLSYLIQGIIRYVNKDHKIIMQEFWEEYK